MTQDEYNKFFALFSESLVYSGIEYTNRINGLSYVVFDTQGILYSVTYNKFKNTYIFEPSEKFKSQYKKYGLPDNALPIPQMVYESVAFSYKIRNIVIKAKKNISSIYQEILIDSDIILQMRGNFETYMVMNSGFSGFAIGYDKESGLYGFKRYILVNTLYKICDIPLETKPGYADLYKKTKNYYMAQTVLENLQHLYDF